MKKRILVKTPKFCSKNFIVIFLIMFLFSFSMFLSGCWDFVGTQSSKTDIDNSTTTNGDNNSEMDTSTETSISDYEETTQTSNPDETSSSVNDGSSSESTTETTTSKLTIKAYYANSDGNALVGEERVIEGSHKYLEAFLELMKPPVSPGLVKLVPGTTKVNKITDKNGNIDLDLSKNFVDDRFKSDLTDILLIHSIVNTLTEFKEINTVTFYIDGEKGTTLGQLDISGPIFRDESSIQNSK